VGGREQAVDVVATELGDREQVAALPVRRHEVAADDA
jgi:hypothetical protein